LIETQQWATSKIYIIYLLFKIFLI
jgi:hypothetical protein